MKLPVVYIFTHDSVHVGEDGPTHQPIEQIEALRLIPGLTVLRPADAAETAMAWQLAAENTSGPTALILSRQDLPTLGGDGLDDIGTHGARIVRSGGKSADVVLAASGSEVGLALEAAEILGERGVATTVASVMCRERLECTSHGTWAGFPDAPVVWIEAGVTTGWRALSSSRDRVVGIERFGESGPGAAVAAHMGLTPAVVADVAEDALSGRTG